MATYNGHQEDSSGNILLSIGNGMTATLETGSTASQAYTKGAYLFFNNKLCKASTSITSGTTLAIGTNLTQTTIGAELTSHLIASNGDEFYFDYKDGKAGYYPNASKTASQFVPFGGGNVTTILTIADVPTTAADYTLSAALSSFQLIAFCRGTVGWDGNQTAPGTESVTTNNLFYMCTSSYLKSSTSGISIYGGSSNQSMNVGFTVKPVTNNDSKLNIKRLNGSSGKPLMVLGI